MLLGPSLLGLVPLSAGILLIAEIGVLLLLFHVGLETDLGELLRVGGPAMAVALVGMVVPFVGGYALARMAGFTTLTAIFVGAALTATSIGITSRVLSDLGLLASREGQIILGAAVADDILGLVVLAVVSQVAATGSVGVWEVGKAALLSFGFLLVALVVGMPLGRLLVRRREGERARDPRCGVGRLRSARGRGRAGRRSAAIVGAFRRGPGPRAHQPQPRHSRCREPGRGRLRPVFFVAIGAQVDVGYLNPAQPPTAGAPPRARPDAVARWEIRAGFAAWGGVRRSFIGRA